MMSDLIKGFKYALSGFSLIGKPKIRIFVIIPALINTLLFLFAILFAADTLDDFINSLSGMWQWLEWLLWPIFVLVSITIVFFTFTIIANLIGSPFNGFLAEKVEIHLSGKQLENGDLNISSEIIKAIRSESAKILYFAIRAIPLLLLFFVPGVQIIWLLFGAWMLALEYMDYPMGNHGMNFRQEKMILQEKRALMMGFGGGVMLMTLIPIVNFIAMPVAVCAATRLYLDEFNQEKTP